MKNWNKEEYNLRSNFEAGFLAIDFHDKKFYGNKNHFEIIGSKGGKYVKKYIEASLTNPKYFISAYSVNQITNNKIKSLARNPSALADG